MPLGPIVAGPRLAEDEIVGPEQLTEGSGTDTVHRARLQVHQDCSWHIPPSSGFVVVDIDALQLQIGITMVGPCWINTMLVRDDLPELRTDLIAALPTLDMDQLTHGFWSPLKRGGMLLNHTAKCALC